MHINTSVTNRAYRELQNFPWQHQLCPPMLVLLHVFYVKNVWISLHDNSTVPWTTVKCATISNYRSTIPPQCSWTTAVSELTGLLVSHCWPSAMAWNNFLFHWSSGNSSTKGWSCYKLLAKFLRKPNMATLSAYWTFYQPIWCSRTSYSAVAPELESRPSGRHWKDGPESVASVCQLVQRYHHSLDI